MPRTFSIDLTGHEIGFLKVLDYCALRTKWRCECVCGLVCYKQSGNLRGKCTDNLSCGCQQKANKQRTIEENRPSVDNQTGHGESAGRCMTVEYNAWLHAKHRHRSNPEHYASTFMCWGWRSSFPAFLADMGRRPPDKTSIDRIDGRGHYSCGKCGECLANGWTANCRWADDFEQAQNKLRNTSKYPA